jgi:chaperonin cofactor prefoldin
MGGDDTTKELPTDDRLDSLISLVHQIAVDVRSSSEMLERLEARLDQLDARQQRLEERQERVEERLERLETKVDERLHDTRPMWEALQTQITELRTDMEKGFRRLDHKVELYHKTLIELYADHRDLEERVDKLEEKAS